MISINQIIEEQANAMLEINNYTLSRKVAFLSILETYRYEIDEIDMEIFETIITRLTTSINTLKSMNVAINSIFEQLSKGDDDGGLY